MKTKFTDFIKESLDIHYGISNIFSEEHRTMLSRKCLMVDVDKIYTLDNKIYIILEDKYKFESKLAKYKITEKESWQRKILKKFSTKLNSFFVLFEESTKVLLRVNQKNENIPTKLPYNRHDLIEHDTANKLYLETRSFSGNLYVKSVMYLKDSIDQNIIDQINKQYKMFEVDLSKEKEGFIIIKSDTNEEYKIVIGSKKSWVDQYWKMKIM